MGHRLSYVTLDETKDYLNIVPTDTTNDNLLNTFRESSSKIIDECVGYTFEITYGISEDRLNQKDLDVIVLERWPVVGICNIESGVDYQLDDVNGVIYLDTPFTGDFTLTYSGGQDPPEQVKVACMELTSLTWSRRKTIGLSAMNMGDFSVSIRPFQKEYDDILDTLHEYRDMPLVRRGYVNQQL
jgi:hypothetical protein